MSAPKGRAEHDTPPMEGPEPLGGWPGWQVLLPPGPGGSQPDPAFPRAACVATGLPKVQRNTPEAGGSHSHAAEAPTHVKTLPAWPDDVTSLANRPLTSVALLNVPSLCLAEPVEGTCEIRHEFADRILADRILADGKQPGHGAGMSPGESHRNRGRQLVVPVPILLGWVIAEANRLGARRPPRSPR